MLFTDRGSKMLLALCLEFAKILQRAPSPPTLVNMGNMFAISSQTHISSYNLNNECSPGIRN